MNSPIHRIRRCFWTYRDLFAFLCLALGVVIAISMVRHESQLRAAANARAIKAEQRSFSQLQGERLSRITAQDLTNQKVAAQIARIAAVNEKQNQIIKALLAIRENDPSLFEGVTLPTPSEFQKQIASDRAAAKPKPTRKPVPKSTPKPTPTRTTPTSTVTQPTVTPSGGSTATTPTPTPVVPAPTPVPTPPAPQPIIPVSPTQVICGLTQVCLPPLGI